MLVAPRYRSEGPTHGAHRARVWGVGSGAHNPLVGMPREAVDRASRIRLHGTPHRGIATFTNYGLIRMGDARVDAIDDFAERTRHFHK